MCSSDLERLEKLVSGRLGKVLRLKPEDITKAEKWFLKRGYATIFFCRFIPLIRSLRNHFFTTKYYFLAKKSLWNDKHDIVIYNRPVELYIQDVKDPHVSTGVYSLLNKKWLIEPDPIVNSKIEVDMDLYTKKLNEYKDLNFADNSFYQKLYWLNGVLNNEA